MDGRKEMIWVDGWKNVLIDGLMDGCVDGSKESDERKCSTW
jgi:hypothetical protein